MYVPTPEAAWNLFIGEILSSATLMYLLGVVAVFAVIILVLEFLDSTKVGRK